MGPRNSALRCTVGTQREMYLLGGIQLCKQSREDIPYNKRRAGGQLRCLCQGPTAATNFKLNFNLLQPGECWARHPKHQSLSLQLHGHFQFETCLMPSNLPARPPRSCAFARRPSSLTIPAYPWLATPGYGELYHSVAKIDGALEASPTSIGNS